MYGPVELDPATALEVVKLLEVTDTPLEPLTATMCVGLPKFALLAANCWSLDGFGMVSKS